MPIPENIRPLRRSNARMRVFEQIKQWIEAGEVEPGEALKDSEIAERLGVSRTPVREALQILETMGMVTAIPGQSTRVSPTHVGDAALLYPLLGVIVAYASEVAVPKLNARTLSRLRSVNEKLLAAAEAGNILATRAADRDFHDIFVARAENRYLSAVVASLDMQVRRLENSYVWDTADWMESYATHSEIVDAAASGDVVRVRELTRMNYEHGGVGYGLR